MIDKIIREEGIKAEDADVEAKLEEFAKAANKSLEDYKKDVSDSQREYIANDIVINKLFDFLKSNNNMTEKAEKPAEKKTAAKKSTAKKDTEEKPAAKKTTAKKDTEEKPAAKKTTAKKATAEKTDSEKPAAKKTTRKPAAKKAEENKAE